MTHDDYVLRMIFEGPYGQVIHQVAIGVGHCVGHDVERISPPSPLFKPMAFEEVAIVLKKKQLRKDMFKDAAGRMGQKLADSMEDKEGWHGSDRQETSNQIEGQ